MACFRRLWVKAISYTVGFVSRKRSPLIGHHVEKKWPVFDDFGSRPFLIQSDLSVENGRFRLKPQIGLSYTIEKGLFFDSTIFD